MRTGAAEDPGSAVGERSAEFVQSLERGLTVIRCFSRETPTLTLTEVARAAGLSRATARRFLHTLESLGYCATDGRSWFLRPRVLDLGYAYLSSVAMWDVVQDHLEALVQQTHESSSASVLDGPDIIYTVRVPTKRIMSMSIEVGTRLPAYATSMGRVLLAGLAEPAFDSYLELVSLHAITPHTVCHAATLREIVRDVQQQGYCLLDQELEVGIRSVAAPLHDPKGKVVAAINVSSHASRVSLDELRSSILPCVMSTARAIEADLCLRR
jgi:IclR family pca regulon transcriptional regulator